MTTAYDGPVPSPWPEDQPPERRLEVQRASDIAPKPVHWLDHGRLPKGALVILGGEPGLGKSTIAYAIAADVTHGRLDGDDKGNPRSVVVVATEDAWAEVIVPRLMAAGADLDRVLRVEAVEDDLLVGLSLPQDNERLRDVIADYDVALVLLDPLLSRLSSKLDTHKDAEVRQALEPLTRVANATHCTILGLLHLNKAGHGSALARFMASTAFVAVARVAFMVTTDPEDESGGRRLLGMAKNNLGVVLPPRAFRVDPWEQETDHGTLRAGRICWLEDLTGRSLDQVLYRLDGHRRGDVTTASDAAGEWLREQLDAGGGCADRADLVKAAAGDFSESALKRGRDAAGVMVHTGGFPRRSQWYLPELWHVVNGALVERLATPQLDLQSVHFTPDAPN